MAGGHVDVAERRLRPIYDCLDNGNNKKAIQEADKVLKKQKDLLCAKALKALAFLRLGRCDESSALLHEVHAQHPSDESTLQAMAICYREMHDLELMADMYENAHKMKPDNEEILSSLFMAHVRLGNYKKQQQTAMAMHRLRPDKNPYYFWAVMSIVMQAETADEKLAKTMFLPLAERMSQKYVTDGKIEAEAEVQLYLMILTMMDKHEAALNVIQGELGSRIATDPSFQENKEAELLSKLERWPESNKCHKKLMRRDPDQWIFYEEYLKSTFALIDSKYEPSKENQSENEEQADYTVDAAVNLLQSQIDTAVDAGQKIRGPYLAQLELCRYLKTRKLPHPDKLGSLQELLKNYFLKFSDKQICFEDLAGYFDLLESGQREKVIDELFTEVGLSNTDNGTLTFAKDIRQLQRHLTVLQLCRYTGQHNTLSSESKYKLVDELVQRHTHGLQFGKHLLTTDLQYCDNYMLLAAHLLLDFWKTTGSLKHVWQAIVLLERATRQSPSNFHVKLLLIALYAKLGACAPCCMLFESMEIKHIQHDALGYVIANHLSRQGNLAAVSQLFRTMLRFFTINHKDTTEYLITSYKYGSFVKIPEFVRFRSKLQNSLQYALAGAEQLLFEITYEPTLHMTAEQVIHHAEINPTSDVTVYEDVCDNRDLDIYLTWDPTVERISDEDKKYSLNEELAWLRLRNFIIRVLAASVHLSLHSSSSNQSNGNATAEGDNSAVTVLTNLKSGVTDHLKECQKYGTPYNYKINGPNRTGLTSYMSNKCGDIFLSAIEMVLYCNRLLDNGIDKTENDKEELMKTSIVSSLKELLACKKCGLVSEDNGEKVLQPECIEHLTTVIEVLSHVLALTGCCWRLLKPCKQAVSKKKKKKGASAGKDQSLPVTLKSYDQLLAGLTDVCEQIQKLIGDIVPQLLSIDMEGLKIDGPFQNAMNIIPQSTDNALKGEEKKIDREEQDAEGNKDKVDETNGGESEKEVQIDTSQLVRNVWDKVTKSYKETAQNLNDFVKNKLEYAASIKL